MSARFRLATVNGWLYAVRGGGHGPGSREPGLSVTVCDTLYVWREVATYRSEDHQRAPADRRHLLGRDGALAAARDHARYLNRLHGAV